MSRRRRQQEEEEDEYEDDDFIVPDDEEEDDEYNNHAPSQRGRTQRGKGKSSTAPSSKRRRRNNDDDDDGDGTTQSKKGWTLTDEEMEALVANFMRYALFKDLKKEPIKREDVNTLVLGQAHKKKKDLLQKIVDEATVRFRKIFGFELIQIDRHMPSQQELAEATQSNSTQKRKGNTTTGVRLWMLRLAPKNDGIPYDNDETKQQAIQKDLEYRSQELQKDTDAPRLGLLMIILSLIEANGGNIQEDILYDRLRVLNINRQRKHEVFGDVEKTIETFIKQLYLEKKKDDAADEEDMEASRRKNKYIYLAGTRLEKEVEKQTILQYLAQISGQPLATSGANGRRDTTAVGATPDSP